MRGRRHSTLPDVFTTGNNKDSGCTRPPVAAAPAQSLSKSTTDINPPTDLNPQQSASDSFTTDSQSPFLRAFSKSLHQSLRIPKSSLAKHQSLKETKHSKSDKSVAKPFFIQSTGSIWRASKRMFSIKLNQSAGSQAMPASRVISRDDSQITSGQHPTRQRQRTASPPMHIGKEKQKEKQNDSLHLSPFRSLPNAKKKLKALMKWPSVTPSSSADQTMQTSTSRGKGHKSISDVHLLTDNNANWQNSDCKKYQGNSQPRVAYFGRKPDLNRVHECIKDLNISLRFLDDVVKKDKLLMLDGSASVVLDTVLKLLLILNEKRRRHGQENENQALLAAYNSVYHNLAALLKSTDKLTVKNDTATAVERQQVAQLCQALHDSIQELLTQTGETYQPERKTSKKTDAPLANNNERKESLASTSSTSSSAADWAAEDEGEARLEHLDNSLNGIPQFPTLPVMECQRRSAAESVSSHSASRPLSSISTSSSTCGVPTKTPLQSNMHKHHGMHTLCPCSSPSALSNGSRSPPGSDSGVFSMSDTAGSASLLIAGDNSLSNASVQNSPAVMTTVASASGNAQVIGGQNDASLLDEILDKLKLTGAPATTYQECDQQHTANGDVETVTEEVEEMVGDTKIIRKKIITRQKVRHQSVVTTTVTTQHPVAQSSDSILMQLLASPTREDNAFGDINSKGDISPSKDGLELRVVEQQCYKLAGGCQNLTAAGKPVAVTQGSVSCEMLSPTEQTQTTPNNSGSEKQISQQNSKAGSEAKILINKQTQQSLMQQSASLQSFSRQTLFNGRLIKTETSEKFDSAAVKASKSETFGENNEVIERRGDGAYNECSYVKGDSTYHPDDQEMQMACSCSGDSADGGGQLPRPAPKGCPPQPPPRPPKRSVVSSYVQLFGSGTPCNQADFRSSTLATYVHLRDRWNDHFEAHKRKAMTFQFVSTPTQSCGNAATIHGKQDSASSTSSSSSSPKISANRSTKSRHEIEEEGEEGVPVWLPRKPQDEYQNLVDIMNVNDYLKFPKQPAVEAPAERKQLPFRTNLALLDVKLLDEIDVRQYLVCKKSSAEDGPDIRGGPVDALIVHATKTTSEAGWACGHSAHSQGHGFCYQEAFLTTYRTFVAPVDLITKLIYRYNTFNGCVEDSVKKKVAKNTFSLLVRVVDDLSAVDVNEAIMHLLGELIYSMIANGELNLSRLLRQKLMERYKIKRQRTPEEIHPAVSPDSSTVSGKSGNWIDFKASLLAEQFTFLDWYYFQKIELSEMLLWAQEQSEEHSPNLTSFTEHFNKMSYWVRTRILEQADQKERERVFGKFVKIMRHLRRLNNFNSCLALLSALDSGPIRRLDWPKAVVEALNEHSSLIDSTQSFKTYRMALAEAKPPCLPYIGLILQDLTFVHIGNPNNLPADQCQGRADVLNFAKRWQQYTILDNMRRFKAWPYGIKKNEFVLSSLNNFDCYISEDAMWDISEKIKPRQQHSVAGVARRIILNPS